MRRRSPKKAALVQAPSPDDDLRAGLIRDAIIRAGLSQGAAEWQSYDAVPEQAPVKRQKVDETATAGKATEIMKPAIEDRGVDRLHWPLEDFAAQPPTLQDYALSPIETELVWLRESLALSTEREESALKMLKACRIQLHKAYRMIALHHLNSFTCDTEMPPFADAQDTVFSTQH